MWKTRPLSWRRRIFESGTSLAENLVLFVRRALCLIALLIAAPALAAPSVKAVRIDTFPAGAHVVLEVDQPLTPRVFTMANPDRLVIDMPEVIWGVPQTSGPVDSPVIRSFGYAPHVPGVSRLVLDLAEPAQLLGYDLKPVMGGRSHELEIVLATQNRRAPAQPQTADPAPGLLVGPPARTGVGSGPAASGEEGQAVPPPASSDAEAAAAAAQAAAEAAQAARRLIEEEMRRIADERRLLADERQRFVQEERMRMAALQAAEEARQARLRESAGPNLLRPTIAPITIAPPPPVAAPLAVPVRGAPVPAPVAAAPPAGPLKTPLRAEAAVRRALATAHSPRLKPGARVAGSPYAPTMSDVSGLNALFDRPAGQQVAMAAPRSDPAPTPAPPPAPPTPPVRKMLVVLDPGHGGKDPGASRNGVREKDVVLDFAKLLREKLVATGRYEVHMTRNADRFVELEDRVEAARVMNADILISIHADSLDAADVSGATAYLISEQGSNATLEQIVQNRDAAGATVAGVTLIDADIDIARTIIDLARRTTRNLSKEFADEIMTEFGKIGPVVRRAVRPANYVVLRAPDTPAVLLELGFMSNDADLKRLQSAEWRGKAADAVLKALDSWRKQRNAL